MLMSVVWRMLRHVLIVQTAVMWLEASAALASMASWGMASHVVCSLSIKFVLRSINSIVGMYLTVTCSVLAKCIHMANL